MEKVDADVCTWYLVLRSTYVAVPRPIIPVVWGRVVLVQKTASFLGRLTYLWFATSIRPTSVCVSLV